MGVFATTGFWMIVVGVGGGVWIAKILIDDWKWGPGVLVLAIISLFVGSPALAFALSWLPNGGGLGMGIGIFFSFTLGAFGLAKGLNDFGGELQARFPRQDQSQSQVIPRQTPRQGSYPHYHGQHAHDHPTKYLLHIHNTVGGDLSTAGPEIPATPSNN